MKTEWKLPAVGQVSTQVPCTCFTVGLSGLREQLPPFIKLSTCSKSKPPQKNSQITADKNPTICCSENFCLKYTDLKKSKEQAVLENSSRFCLCFHFRKQTLIDFTVGGVSHQDSNSHKMATEFDKHNTTGHPTDLWEHRLLPSARVIV